MQNIVKHLNKWRIILCLSIIAIFLLFIISNNWRVKYYCYLKSNTEGSMTVVEFNDINKDGIPEMIISEMAKLPTGIILTLEKGIIIEKTSICPCNISSFENSNGEIRNFNNHYYSGVEYPDNKVFVHLSEIMNDFSENITISELVDIDSEIEVIENFHNEWKLMDDYQYLDITDKLSFADYMAFILTYSN